MEQQNIIALNNEDYAREISIRVNSNSKVVTSTDENNTIFDEILTSVKADTIINLYIDGSLRFDSDDDYTDYGGWKFAINLLLNLEFLGIKDLNIYILGFEENPIDETLVAFNNKFYEVKNVESCSSQDITYLRYPLDIDENNGLKPFSESDEITYYSVSKKEKKLFKKLNNGTFSESDRKPDFLLFNSSFQSFSHNILHIFNTLEDKVG